MTGVLWVVTSSTLLRSTWGQETVVVDAERPSEADAMAGWEAVASIPIAGAPSGTDLGQLLQTVPGARVLRLGGLGDYSTVGLRGASARQVLITLDGIPLNPEGGAAVNLSEWAPEAFDRMLVYKGLAPARFDEPSLGGVVDLVTRSAPRLATISVGGGSFETGRASAALAGPVTGGDALAVVDGLRTGGDFQAFSDGGTRYNAADDGFTERANNQKAQATSLLRWRYAHTGWSVDALDTGLLRNEGLPGPVTAPTSSATLGTLRNLAALRLKFARATTSGEARISHVVRTETLDDRGGELGAGTAWTTSTLQSFGGWTTGRMVTGATWVPQVGLGGHVDELRSVDEFSGVVSAFQRAVADGVLSSELRLAHDRVLLEPQLRAVILDDRSTADSTVRRVLCPGLGAAWWPSPSWVLRASGGRGVRPPDSFELWGNSGVMHGNPELRPEVGWLAEAGTRWEGDVRPHWPAYAEADVFQRSVDDLIAYVQNTQQTAIPVNVDQARVRGVELSSGVSREDLAGVVASGSWTDARSVPEGVAIPRVPWWTIDTGEWVRYGAFTFRHDWDAMSDTSIDSAGLTWTAPRSVHGLELAARWRAWTLDLAVHNVFDARTAAVPRDPFQPDGPTVTEPIEDLAGYPLPGRSVFLALRWEGA